MKMSSNTKQTVRTTMSEPVCRPSRIPTAVGQKSLTSPNSWSLQNSPQHSVNTKRTNGTHSSNVNVSQLNQSSTPRFEAYMMTGDIILNISKKTPRSSIKKPPSKIINITTSPKHSRGNGAFAPHAKYDSSPSDDNSGSGETKKNIDTYCLKGPISKSSSASSSHSSSANNSSSTFSNDAVDCPLIKHRKTQAQSSNNVHETSVSSNDISCSVKTSPTSLNMPNTNMYCKPNDEIFKMNSAPTSPDSENTTTQDFIKRNIHNLNKDIQKKRDSLGRVRTSRSEDPLRDGINNSVVPINIDEDFNSSLNTLLDTRNESDSPSGDGDRIVWTYNAPITNSERIITSPLSHSSSESPQCSESQLISPSSPSSNEATSNDIHNIQNLTNDQSVSEVSAVSNISSPDYQDEQFSTRELCEISDPSDSDSTILASEKQFSENDPNNKIVIQISGEDTSCNKDIIVHETQETKIINNENILREDSPTEDGSDIESLHSFHYSPKGVDYPSAIRLAKRLYHLEGFKRSDVSKHLCKNNEFSRAVAEEYLKYFKFERLTLDDALRKFLKKFSLSGETQERERVLVHFSKRFIDCNPGSFNSTDAAHTLVCALMLLNTDLHGQTIGRKMTCSEFIENLSELNDGGNFPKDILKQLYHSIKNHAIEWAVDENPEQNKNEDKVTKTAQSNSIGIDNPLLQGNSGGMPAIEFKKGYVMKKSCYESANKKTPFGKRGWKMFYCTLRDTCIYLHKDEHGFKKYQVSDNYHNAISIHHSLATKASDYTKKQHVFRFISADQAEYLFQTSDSKELQSWIETINFVCGVFSAPTMSGAIGNSKRFQRPLLPCSRTKLSFQEQLVSHEKQIELLEQSLDEHKQGTVSSKGLEFQNFKEKETYLCYEIKRYKAYVSAMRNKFSEYENQFSSVAENNSGTSTMYDDAVVPDQFNVNLCNSRHGKKSIVSFDDG
uniref:CSON011430 protein n=1 Tax=Culicoides sonorensis TaxID=179676 RepID=A0A336LHI1_CULSO